MRAFFVDLKKLPGSHAAQNDRLLYSKSATSKKRKRVDPPIMGTGFPGSSNHHCQYGGDLKSKLISSCGAVALWRRRRGDDVSRTQKILPLILGRHPQKARHNVERTNSE